MGKKLERAEERIREHLARTAHPTERDAGLIHDGVRQGLSLALQYCTEAHYESVPPHDYLLAAESHVAILSETHFTAKQVAVNLQTLCALRAILDHLKEGR